MPGTVENITATSPSGTRAALATKRVGKRSSAMIVIRVI